MCSTSSNTRTRWVPAVALHQNQPPQVCAYVFADKELGKVCLYGVDNMTHYQGWVSIGTDDDTARCPVASLQRWY